MDRKVSVIVPIYNSEKYLEKCINSIINQTYANLEIILVNDGSTDNSLKICQEFSKMDERILVYSKINEGVSKARNKGIEISSGEYIVFVDADDTIHENYIKIMLENSVDNYYLIKSNFKNSIKAKLYSKEEFLNGLISGKVFGACWGYLFCREILKDIYFDNNTSYMEDAIFMVRYLLKVKYVKVIKEELYNYNYNTNSLTNIKKNIERKIDQYLYSIEQIENILIENGEMNESYKRYLNNRKIGILESGMSKLYDVEEIKKLLNKKKILEVINIKTNSLKYKLFIMIARKKSYKKMLSYIKLRHFLKKLIKGRV